MNGGSRAVVRDGPRPARTIGGIERAVPAFAARRVLKCVAVLFGLALLWAVFARLEIVVVAEGRLVPETDMKIVQPAEAGIIRELLVREGDRVTAGQVLARLDSTLALADATALRQEAALKRLELRRIDAELAGQSMARDAGDEPQLFARMEARMRAHRQVLLDSLDAERAGRQRTEHELAAATRVQLKFEQSLPGLELEAAAHERLAAQGLLGSLQAGARRREVQERMQELKAQQDTVAALGSMLDQHDRRLAQLASTYESGLHELRFETLASLVRLEEDLAKVAFREALLVLRAPQSGVISGLATTTSGAVLAPGTILLRLVPDDEPLLAEVLIHHRDIGFVSPGQSVHVKLAAYPFQKYGLLAGVVRSVGTDPGTHSSTVPDEWGRHAPPAFRALVALNSQHLAAGDLVLPLAAGMQVSAEIVQGHRTVLEYLLSPVSRVVAEAGRER